MRTTTLVMLALAAMTTGAAASSAHNPFAKATCTEGHTQEQNCTYQGIAFTVGDWASSKPLRKQACEQGYINPNYQVLTNGDWYITTDDSANYAALRSEFGGNLQNYCP